MFKWFWTIFSLGAPEKETISKGVEGCLQRFFPGGLSKIGELLIQKRTKKKQQQQKQQQQQVLCWAGFQLFHCYRSSKQVFLERMSILRR